nr:c-type cytochrome [uncultured Helicobacter sp.]
MCKFILLAFYLSFLFFTACSTDDKTTQSNQIIPLTQDSTTTSSSDNSQDSVQNVADPELLYARCASCHGKDGKSVAPGSVGNVLIASLNKEQVIESLRGFRAGTLSRGGNSVIMYMQTKHLSDADIEALATYIDAF